MSKFMVLYMAPVSVLEDWKKTDPATRKAAEEKMQGEWKAWMTDNGKSLADKGAGVGKTKRITGQGIADTKNEIMLYAIVEAETHEAAAKLFAHHPHLQIPQSSIEVMAINPFQGM
jgi:hypothetical protein